MALLIHLVADACPSLGVSQKFDHLDIGISSCYPEILQHKFYLDKPEQADPLKQE